MLRDGVIQTEMQKMETKEAGLQEFNTQAKYMKKAGVTFYKRAICTAVIGMTFEFIEALKITPAKLLALVCYIYVIKPDTILPSVYIEQALTILEARFKAQGNAITKDEMRLLFDKGEIGHFVVGDKQRIDVIKGDEDDYLYVFLISDDADPVHFVTFTRTAEDDKNTVLTYELKDNFAASIAYVVCLETGNEFNLRNEFRIKYGDAECDKVVDSEPVSLEADGVSIPMDMRVRFKKELGVIDRKRKRDENKAALLALTTPSKSPSSASSSSSSKPKKVRVAPPPGSGQAMGSTPQAKKKIEV
jgi:hypothetical protein